jgi:hypothetical protein
MSEKVYISAQELLDDSFHLGLDIIQSQFRPDFIVAIWRGGTPVGIAIQEILTYFSIETDHIAIRTSSYTGINQRSKTVRVHGLNYIEDYANHDNSLLIVDDVFDSGLSIDAVIKEIQQKCRRNTPADIRIATPWYKPGNNQTRLVPDFYRHETDKWLVFPHELSGLTVNEIIENKPNMRDKLSMHKDYTK